MTQDADKGLPPLSNWDKTNFAYGFVLDRSFDSDYANSIKPKSKNTTGLEHAAAEDIHLLNLNPSQISVAEPIATSISFTQGGSKFIESRGGIIKDFTIRGTTGLLPPKAPHADHIANRSVVYGYADSGQLLTDTVFDEQLLKSTGFYEFYRLRRLFRTFMAERRAGGKVTMHWLDFKGDEFWIIEPMLFTMTRKKFTYDYSIQFKGIEPSEAPVVAAAQAAGANPYPTGGDPSDVPHVAARDSHGLINPFGLATTHKVPFAVDKVQARALARLGTLKSAGDRFMSTLTSGVLKIKFQGVLSKVFFIQELLADAATIRRTIGEESLSAFKQLSSALYGLSDAIRDNTPDAFKADASEWWLEVRTISDAMQVHYARKYGSTPGEKLIKENEKFTEPRASQGMRTGFITEDEDSPGSLPTHPLLGSAGFGLIGDLNRMAGIKVLRSEEINSGETIFDLATRLTGNVHRFVDLVILNNLTSPYIVDQPANKPPGTLAWGESILVPTLDTSALSNSAGVSVNTEAQALSSVTTAVSTGADIIDTSPPTPPGAWGVDQWAGFTVTMVDGAALGDKRIIISNTEDTLTLNRVWDTLPGSGDAYRITLEVFSLRRPSSPETRAFGRDILGIFHHDTRLPNGVDIMMGPHGDYLSVEGEENYKQSVTLRLETPLGSNRLHPTYGVIGTIGSRLEPNKLLLHSFYVRQGLLADPRTQSVANPRLSFDAGVLRFEASIQPVRVQRTINFRVALR